VFDGSSEPQRRLKALKALEGAGESCPVDAIRLCSPITATHVDDDEPVTVRGTDAGSWRAGGSKVPNPLYRGPRNSLT
jgi:hypothetical protein